MNRDLRELEILLAVYEMFYEGGIEPNLNNFKLLKEIGLKERRREVADILNKLRTEGEIHFNPEDVFMTDGHENEILLIWFKDIDRISWRP